MGKLRDMEMDEIMGRDNAAQTSHSQSVEMKPSPELEAATCTDCSWRSDVSDYVELCDLHASTSDLLKALKRAREEGLSFALSMETIDQIDVAIKKAGTK
jgi:hypothetical protein